MFCFLTKIKGNDDKDRKIVSIISEKNYNLISRWSNVTLYSFDKKIKWFHNSIFDRLKKCNNDILTQKSCLGNFQFDPYFDKFLDKLYNEILTKNFKKYFFQ